MKKKNDPARRAAEKWCGHVRPQHAIGEWISAAVVSAGVIFAAIAVARLCSVCESLDEEILDALGHERHHAAAESVEEGNSYDASPSASESQSASSGGNSAPSIDPARVSWFGNPKCSAAAEVAGAQIGSLKITRSGLSYKWVKGGCEALGASGPTDYTQTIACAGYADASGAWHFAKFDWISTSRTTRDFKNIDEGYNGWSAAAFFGAKKRGFVIVSADGKRRTNFITEE